MKKKVFTVLTALVLMSAFVMAQTSTKIAVINPQKVLQNSIAGKKILKKLQNLQKAKQNKINRMRRELSNLEQKLQTQGFTMSDAARLDLQKKIDSKKATIQQEIKAAQMDIQYQSNKLLGQITKELEPIIKQIRKEKGIAIIFDLTRAGVIDMDKSLDITDLVIQRYNKMKLSATKKK